LVGRIFKAWFGYQRERARLAEEAEKKRLHEEIEARKHRRMEAARSEQETRREQEIREIQAKERHRRLYEVRICEVCNGKGICLNCNGKGSLTRFYLSSAVGNSSASSNVRGCSHHPQGMIPVGCTECNGGGDGELWGKYSRGKGQCLNCSGEGKLIPPIGGWPDVKYNRDDVMVGNDAGDRPSPPEGDVSGAPDAERKVSFWQDITDSESGDSTTVPSSLTPTLVTAAA